MKSALRRLQTAGLREGSALVLERLGGGALAARLRRGRTTPDPTVDAEALAALLRSILGRWGFAPADAETTVDHILYADLHGIDSHGCAMVRQYHRAWAAGSLAADAATTVVRETTTTALLDGGGGLGHLPADTAMRLAIAKCQATGVGVVSVRRSGHFGAAGSYATLAAQEGLIALVTSDTATPAVVPTFGLAPKLGTNPIALAAPAHHNRPFLLDMATSTVPVGRLATAWRRGMRIPIGWANDRKGKPLTDPRLAFEARCLTPLGSVSDMGSHKGYGLAVAVAILSSVLSGARNQLEHDPVGRVGHFFLALDPAHFRADNTFSADLDDLLDDLRASPAHDPAQPVLVAGDPEYAVAAHRRVHGIPLAPRVFADLREVAEASGVAFTLGERS